MEQEHVSFQFLREITDGFSEKRIVGEGAFGVVYKGVTKNGDDVAVKKLKFYDVNLNYKQFQNEFYNLTKLKHQNIVELLGYCFETEEKPFIMPDGSKELVDETYTALCFEYLHNGSLQKHLSDEFCGLDWPTRFKIIKGTCDGLKYIHVDQEEPMYHLDLKPDNILLDKDMVPKIADFGLSRIIGKEQKRTTRSSYGTPGYQPPEYIDNGDISEKFDIFSLGVVMIRIVSGPICYPKCLYMDQDQFIDQVRENWRKGLHATCSTDSSLEAYYCHQIETCTRIALNCMERESQKRPDIVSITKMLNEIQADIVKVQQKGSHKNVSTVTMHNNKIEMRTEQNDICGQHQNIHLRSGPSYNELEFADALETSSDVVEELIVGRTEEKGRILTALLEGTSNKFVILPIHGIGGIGKTTFARLIYNDPKFKSYSKVWVDVSGRFDLNKISESIISQLSGKESQVNERQMTRSCLTKLLSGKNILIVLDDMWEDNPFQLKELKDMLYLDDSNIIILVTTRSADVAKKICNNHQPYKILPLTHGMCWDIIKQRSGFEHRDDKEQLRGIGQEIAQKCGGVALAALSLGFTLKSMNFDHWMKVKDSNIWNEPVPKDSSMPNHVLASLKLSYSYMSPCLKQCFTYCATFPKGHKIVKDDLIYQWVSLDFIKPTKLLSDVQLCEKYILQLLGLSFFQQPVSLETTEVYYSQATFFTMHDLVHDLAILLLGNEVLDQSNQVLDQSKQRNTMERSCQYALLSDCSKPLNLCLASHGTLIALRFLDGCRSKLSGAAFAPASSLRVLDLSNCSILKLSDSIGQLKELRYLTAPRIKYQKIPECITMLSNLIYLNLHGSSIVALPDSIGELKSLRHFDLSYCSRMKQLPVSFSNLSNLIYLNLHGSSIAELPKSIGELESLVHLDLSDCSQIQQLPVSFGNLEKLAHLNLSNCYNISVVSESLGNLSQLEHLNLKYCRNIGDITGQLGGLTKLKYLNLARVPLDENLNGLPQVLVNLTNLRFLNLENCLDKDESGLLLQHICELSNLEQLDLYRNSHLYSIPESIRNLSKLHTLNLSCCFELQELPASISEIDSLRYLHVEDCSSLDKSTLPQHRISLNLLPNFVVHATDGEHESNICQLEHENPTALDIIRLENVKSIEEAQRIKMAEKDRIKELGLIWTNDPIRSVDNIEILEQLKPPKNVKKLLLQGYKCVSFPSWMMVDISMYLPHLEAITLRGLPICDKLPPLGQLPKLEYLSISLMDNIRKIDADFYGGARAFPELGFLSLYGMKCLEEWNTAYSECKDGMNQLVFPKLRGIYVKDCPKLSFKSCLPLGNNKTLTIFGCDKIILSSLVDSGHIRASTNKLQVHCCKVPLHEWSLLYHLPYLKELRIDDCSDLTCSSEDILQHLSSLKALSVMNCKSIAVLPEWSGDLTSLEKLEISYCDSIKTLPESIQQLTCLKCLEINKCPELVLWCKSGENKMKLAQIKEIVLDGEELSVIRSQRIAIPPTLSPSVTNNLEDTFGEMSPKEMPGKAMKAENKKKQPQLSQNNTRKARKEARTSKDAIDVAPRKRSKK